MSVKSDRVAAAVEAAEAAKKLSDKVARIANCLRANPSWRPPEHTTFEFTAIDADVLRIKLEELDRIDALLAKEAER